MSPDPHDAAPDAHGDEPAMRAWRVHAYGEPLEALTLDSLSRPQPGPGEVRVRVQAIPLNLNDLERVTGGNMMVRPDLPATPGMEVMGVVDVCGEGAEEWAGCRVVAMGKEAHGGFAEYTVCPAVSTFAMPDAIPLPDASALFFPFHLAWLGLVDRADLRAGETVLVHAGAGGSGSAAIQLATHLGARVLTTAGTDEKAALCRELGADVAVNYETEDFAEVVLAETDGAGVDVVFDNVGEAVFDASIGVTAYNGRYLMMGFASDKTVADEPLVVPRRLATANIHLCGVLLAYATDDVRSLVKTAMGWNFTPGEVGTQVMAEIVDLVEQGAVRAVVGQTVGFEDIPAALTALADRATVGRTVALLEDAGATRP